MSFARNLLGIVVYLFVLPRMLGLTGVWLAVPAADISALIFGTFLLTSRLRDFTEKSGAEKALKLTHAESKNG